MCAIPHTPYGAPHALTSAVVEASTDLASTSNESAQRSAWVLLRGSDAARAEWLGSKQRLSGLYALWKAVLGGRAEVDGGRGAAERVERELRLRAACLECIVSFLMRVPEAFSAPLLKPIVGSLLPPNTALLASTREHAVALGKESPGFRAAFVTYRCRLYQLLGALPSSTLSAKLLNVVMPLVVADIVDPSAASARPEPGSSLPHAALAQLLDEADDALGSSADDERAHEPLRDGVPHLVTAACDDFEALRSSFAPAADAEAEALAAALTLFSSVFRLQPPRCASSSSGT